MCVMRSTAVIENITASKLSWVTGHATAQVTITVNG